jgi:hypothetical protein
MKTKCWFLSLVAWLSVPALLPGQFAVKVTRSPQTADRIVISWPTVTGKAYTLRTSTDVAAGWTVYPTEPARLVATGAAMQYELAVDSVTRFFRVAEESAAPAADPEVLANQIVNGTTPTEVVTATQQALAAGGVTVGDVGRVDLPAAPPAASWFVDPYLVFNLATEAHGRAVSGRFTLDDLGLMWQELGFPFLGQGTPGEQLLAFLRGWLEDVATDPSAANFFTPRFIAAMVGHQEPPVSLTDAATRPADVRLSLLEVELLMAAFDRAYQPDVNAPEGLSAVLSETGDSGVVLASELQGDVGPCTQMKQLYGTIGSKLVQKGVGYIKGEITTKALMGLGMTEAEVKLFNTYQKFFDALNIAMKIIKMLQIYASTEVLLTVEGANPVHKPHKSQPRVLVPVSARAGIPDEAWQQFQQSQQSDAYKAVKDCLGFAGLTLPYDLKDIADKVGSWRIAWDLIRGSPKHATIPSDVNIFDASSAGNPFGMKLVRDGGSAKATLKVDVAREPELATTLKGPVVTANVTVKAKVFTAEPPDPALVAKVTSLLGTISALTDLSTGWIQTMLPPTSTTKIKVQFHDLPIAIEASVKIDMEFNFTHFRDEPPEYRQTAKGDWTARLEPDQPVTAEKDIEAYSGSGLMNFQSATKRKLDQDPGDICTETYTEKPINGSVGGKVRGAFNIKGQPRPDDPPEFVMGIADAGSAPGEEETLTVRCGDDEFTTVNTLRSIMIGAINALNLMDDVLLSEIPTSKLPGLHLDRWEAKPDGTLERMLTGSKTVSVILLDGTAADTEVISQNNLLRLQPIYGPPPN